MNSDKDKKSLTNRVIKRLKLKATGKGRKPFYKSVRFGYEIFEAIDAVPGDGFNEIFTNICLDYIRTIPEREKKVKELDKEIAEKKGILGKLNNTIKEMQILIFELQTLQHQLQRVNQLADSVTNELKA